MTTSRAVRIGAMILAAAVAASSARAAEEVFAFDKAHTKVGFRIRHTVSRVEGRFKDFDGTIWIDREHPAQSRVELTIQASSIDTASENRDRDLRSDSFFDVEKFPTITFKSTKVESRGGDNYAVTGDFTMHGVTKSIVVPVQSNGFAKVGKTEKAGFTIAFPLDRKDYGITWNKTLDQGAMLLGDQVDISIEIEANRKEADAPKSGGR